ncbi:hypothetical protein CkaCkLH20_03275 [Colletotrichum karsti]|uniref:Uncharacterized protein n=1 Tax=Colletotrichum karsti TaxID=1095194 RepID=A0A9P6I8Z4_9PEZI|nr:uncharacterized protein CkaCkLH20_03275 [Colletotrichum karsti]KAF9879042.1 hypothetical protein CkaCkLH20_03275 [Colletotrichum karsti]
MWVPATQEQQQHRRRITISLIIANVTHLALLIKLASPSHPLRVREDLSSVTTAIMKPVVGAGLAWQCTVISVFAVVILGILAILFNSNHPELVGGKEDPQNGGAVAGTLFVSVLVYIVRRVPPSRDNNEADAWMSMC